MKLLMLTPHPPYPPNSGGRTRQWEQIRYLGARHELTVLCYAFTQEEYEQRLMLDRLCERFVVVLHPGMLPQNLAANGNLPAPVRGYYTHSMKQTLESLLSRNEFDCVIIENLFMAPFVRCFSIPAVLQEYNIESRLYLQYAQLPQREKKERALWKATWMLTSQYENEVWPMFPVRTVVSMQDKQDMDARCRVGKSVLVENGVNLEALRLLPLCREKRVLFMGSLDYFPNSDAAYYLAREIMPHVWKQDPNVSLCIAGRNPHPSIRELASDPRIDIIANPPDMCDVAGRCCASVVPMRIGGGTRIKILDSLAMGLPAISTTVGSEGLEVRDGEHLLIRDDPEEFARGILSVIEGGDLRERLRCSGRQLVEQRYDWRAIFALLDREIVQLVDHPVMNLSSIHQ